MHWTPCHRLRYAGGLAVALALLVAGQSQAATVNSTINLGPANGAGNLGDFSATVTLGAGSQLQLGPSAIAGNYKQRVVFFNTNIGFSAENQTSNLSLSPTTIGVSTANNTGVADLDYDDFAPGTPETLNSFSSVLSGSVVTGMTINATGIGMSTSVGTLTLTPTFNGSIKNISFTSTGTADVSGGGGVIDGTYSVTLNGSVTGSLDVLGIPIDVGTLYTLDPDTVVTFDGSLPVGVALSDTGIPFGVGQETTVNKNTMLAAFGANLSGITLPFSFVAPLATSTTFSVPSSSSGVTSIRIQNTTLVANINLSNVVYNKTGTVPNVLVPEPSMLALGSLGLVGLLGMVRRRRNVTR